MVLFTIRLRRTGIIREGWSSPRSEEPFLMALLCWGGLRPAPSVSLYSLLILVSFLLYGALRAGNCPISPSFQLLGVVVRTKKYGRVRRKALNAIMTAFPLNTFVVFSYFSTFPAPWNDGECHYRWQVTPSTLGYTVPRKGFSSPRPRRDFSLRLGLWPNIVIDMGLLVFYPPQ